MTIETETKAIRGPSNVLKPHETKKLLTLVDLRTKHGRRDQALLAIMALGGLRSCEAVALRVDHIEPYVGGQVSIKVRNAKRKAVDGKGRPVGPTYRSVVLPAKAARMVHDYIAHTPKARYWLFPGRADEHISTDTAQRAVVPYLAKLGRSDMRTHGLRHTCASQIVRETSNIWLAAEVLGHSNVETTRRAYVQYSLEDAARAAGALGAAMTRRKPRA
jgi:integrase